jgi:tetratricopeptide (TPR) repeat protein
MWWSRPSGLFFFAQACIFFKQHARALQALEALLREAPEHPRAWSIAGFLYAEKGRLGESIAALERALALSPDNAAILFNLGFVLQKAGRHEEAIERMARAVELNPILDRAWYGLGISLIHCGRFHEAIQRLTEAARLQPFNPFARYQLAAAWFKLGEPEKVRAEYRKLKRFDPKIAAHVRADFGVPRDHDEVD